MQTLFISENAFFSEDKKLNIVGIFDQLLPEGFPAAKQFALSGVIKAEPKSKISLKLRVTDPQGNLSAAEKKFELELGASGVANFVVNVTLAFKLVGEYTFQLHEGSKKDPIGEARLIVNTPKGGQNASTASGSN